MPTLVVYAFCGSAHEVSAMKDRVENLGLGPLKVGDGLELTYLSEGRLPLEALGWRVVREVVGGERKQPAPSPATPPKRAPTTGDPPAGQHVVPAPAAPFPRRARQAPKGRQKVSREIWALDKRLKEKARADLRLDEAPVVKPIEPSPSLVREVEEHNKNTAARSQKASAWMQGTTYTMTLHSRRPTRIYLSCVCSNCRVWSNPVSRYRETSRGTVYLCSRCNDVLRERSFGSRGGDAMHAAVGRKRSR